MLEWRKLAIWEDYTPGAQERLCFIYTYGILMAAMRDARQADGVEAFPALSTLRNAANYLSRPVSDSTALEVARSMTASA